MENKIIKIQDMMTSKEIAELTGKRHANVIRDIDNILLQLSDNQVKLRIEFNSNGYKIQPSFYQDPLGRPRQMYNLNKKATLLLASGYDIVLRAKIIDRWEELEMKAQQQFQVPTTFAEALRLAAQQQELIEQQQKQIGVQQKTIFQQTQHIKEQAPLAELGDAVMKYDDDISIGEMAKILNQHGINIGATRLRNLLKTEGYLLRDGLPSQKSMNLGVMAITKTKYADRYGNPQIYTKPMITGKGQQYFINKYSNKRKQQ